MSNGAAGLSPAEAERLLQNGGCAPTNADRGQGWRTSRIGSSSGDGALRLLQRFVHAADPKVRVLRKEVLRFCSLHSRVWRLWGHVLQGLFAHKLHPGVRAEPLHRLLLRDSESLVQSYSQILYDDNEISKETHMQLLFGAFATTVLGGGVLPRRRHRSWNSSRAMQSIATILGSIAPSPLPTSGDTPTSDSPIRCPGKLTVTIVGKTRAAKPSGHA